MNQTRAERSSSAPCDDRWLVVLKILVAALLCARLLVPAEETAQGATLWLVQLWPIVLGVWAWHALRTPGVRIRFGMCDVMLALVVAGHLISATAVLLTEGQKRAAVNMLWEWIGLGIGFFLLRQLIVTRVDRERLLLAFVCVTVSLSGLGIWQHFVFYPQTRVRYAQARQRLDGLLSGSPSSRASRVGERQQRIREARNELLQMGVPPESLSGRMRLAFESRLQDSSEPFGPFALANTFAGFLAMGLVLLIAAGRNFRRNAQVSLVRQGRATQLLELGKMEGGWGRVFEPPESAPTGGYAPKTPLRPQPPLDHCETLSRPVRQGVLVGVAALVAFCLLLTKSRTAWVGTACGLCVVMIVSLRRRAASPNEDDARRRSFRHRWAILLGAAAILGVLLIVAISSGGLDSAVLTESLKSLTYRIEYWKGSWAVVREQPWLGVGPGNFRQHYLWHKLPGSSEEIADPHNFLLGIWTSGGLIAVCGLVGLFVVWTAALRRTTLRRTTLRRTTLRRTPQADDTIGPSSTSGFCGWLWGTVLGFVMVLAFRAVLEDRFDVGLIFLLAGWLAVVTVFRRPSNSFAVSSAGVGAAVLAVMVHLLGAGGIEMPAVVQTVLLLLAVGLSGADRSTAVDMKSNDTRQPDSWKTRLPAVATGIVAVILLMSCLLTATRPVLECQALVALGDAEISEGNHLAAAERSYVAAAVADPLSPEPIDRLAELELQKWRQNRRGTGQFHRVVEFSQEAIRLDPDNWLRYRMLGNRYREAFRRTDASADAVLAVKYLVQALDRYPNNALLRAELAEAHSDAGDKPQARLQAEQALRLDQLNRKRGHSDRFLSEKTREALTRIRESIPIGVGKAD